MCRTLNQVTVQSKKLVWHPVERTPGMRTTVAIGKQPAVFMHQKNIIVARGSVDTETPAGPFRQIFQATWQFDVSSHNQVEHRLGVTILSETTSRDIQTVQSGLGAFISRQLAGKTQGIS